MVVGKASGPTSLFERCIKVLNPLIPVTEYSLPASLLQRIVDILAEMPAKVSRQIINEVDICVQRQDGARRELAKQQLANDIEKEMRERIRSEKQSD